MALTLYNTLTKKKEAFKPIRAGEARVYTCGPTVYNYAHIGNLRAYVFADVLRRTLEYSGYTVTQVVNITDVGHLTSDGDDGDDKMIQALKREGRPFTFEAMQEIARMYETAFKADLNALNIEMPEVMPRASENIPEDIDLVRTLLEKGIAYKTTDGIYFDISKFPAYGARGGFKLGDLKEGARIAINAEKKNPRDFSLWKFSTTNLGWDFPPFGKGFPGWHIECSAMSRKYLGQPFDIHTGGIDHIPTHHQNEMAQSEAAYGAPLAYYWMHSEFVNTSGGEKMSKSEENFLTLRALSEKGIHPLAYRYYLLQTHYRSPLRFSSEALLGAQTAYMKLLRGFSRLEEKDVSIEKIKETDDDLNTPTLIARVWEWLTEKNRNAILDADRILGLDIEHQAKKLAEEMENIPEEIKKLAGAREGARAAKDFQTSDALRARIEQLGFSVNDTDKGPIVSKI